MDKDWGKVLLKLVERVPDWQALTALAIIVCLIVILAVLKSDVFKNVSQSTRNKLVFFIVRYVFIGVFVVIFLTFSWQFKSATSENAAISMGVERAAASQPSSPEKPRVGLPQKEIDDLAESLTILSRRIGAPDGIKDAIEKLKAGDVAPALLILKNDVLAQQKSNTAKAETLRRIGLLELLRNPALALVVYQQSVELDPSSWEAWSKIGLLLERRGDNDGAKAAAQKAMDIGQSRNEPSALGSAYGVLGVIHHNAGRFDEAKDAFDKSRGYFLVAGSKVEFARATNNLARVYYATKDYESAVKYYQEALAENTAAQNERGLAADQNGLAEVLLLRRDYEKALDYLKKSLAISEKLDDREQQALTLSSMSRLYRSRGRTGDLDLAKETSLRALKLKQDNKNSLAVAYELGNLGSIARAQKDYPEAEKKYLEAIELAKRASRFGEAVQQRGLGGVYFDWGKFASALDAFMRAFELDRELPFKSDAALDLDWVGTIYRKLNQDHEACAAWKQAEELYRTAKDDKFAADIRKAMATAKCES